MRTVTPNEEAYTVSQACAALGVSVGTLRRWIHGGQLDAWAVNPEAQRLSYRVRRVDVEAMRQRNRVPARNANPEEARS